MTITLPEFPIGAETLHQPWFQFVAYFACFLASWPLLARRMWKYQKSWGFPPSQDGATGLSFILSMVWPVAWGAITLGYAQRFVTPMARRAFRYTAYRGLPDERDDPRS